VSKEILESILLLSDADIKTS